MFNLYDDFMAYDENMQPYSFSVERHTETANLHSGISNGGFALKSIGNRYILNTSIFKTCKFSFNFKATYIEDSSFNFRVIVGYDEVSRSGKCIDFRFNAPNKNEIIIYDMDNCVFQDKLTVFKFCYPFKDDELYNFELEITEKQIICDMVGNHFEYECESQFGKLAIERDNFWGELILTDISFKSEDDVEIKNIYKNTFIIPCDNGGDIPYSVDLKIDEIGGEAFLFAILDGGTKSRELNGMDRPGQYVVEIDWMEFAYIGVGNDSCEQLFNLFSGEKCFVDPNISHETLKKFFSDTELPITKCYRLGIAKDLRFNEIIFGYNKLSCRNYGAQIGGNQFRFSLDGNLIYSGEALDGRDIFEVLSPFDKSALSLIPENCYNREEVIEHLKNNHYFEIDEKVRFSLNFYTKSNVDYFSVKAKILNVFETEELDCVETETLISTWRKDYKNITANAKFGNFEIGVYKVEFSVYYGEQLYKKIVKTFEVFDRDSDICPSLASGLPFMFAMPNEHKWLMRNAFDFWNPKKSCNSEHYISCITDTPIEASIRKPWEIAKIFKRKWFAWRTFRTAKDYCDKKYDFVNENADYLFFIPIDTGKYFGCEIPIIFRTDYWKVDYMFRLFPEQKAILTSYLKENPEIIKEIDFNPDTDEITTEKYQALMKAHFKEWVPYANKKQYELLDGYNKDLKEQNPNIKRAAYGPFPPYGHPTLSYHSLMYCGAPCNSDLSQKAFDGFCVFEDYPYSCSYQNYRGAFAVMTILLHCPDLKIYPEQYSGSRGGCIDGYVKFAHAPMGAYELLPYYNSTLSFEYVYNTAHRLKDGYHYWSSYGFHRSCREDELEVLVKDWRYVLKYKPAKPMRSIAFLADYSIDEDEYCIYKTRDGRNSPRILNQSESGQAFIYECSRKSGISQGFAFKFDVLKDLKPEECDIIVIPSLKNVDSEYVCEIRRLYESGVNLIAVSDVTGLEDLFGVYEETFKTKVNTLSDGKNSEYIYSSNAEFKYKPSNAKTVLSANDNSHAIIATEHTMLINTKVENLGCSVCYEPSGEKGLYLVSKLLRNTVINTLQKISTKLVFSRDVGLSLFNTTEGKQVILAIDYTDFDNEEHTSKEAVVEINLDNVVGVKSEHNVFVGKKHGIVKELIFNIKPHESVFIELLTNPEDAIND